MQEVFSALSMLPHPVRNTSHFMSCFGEFSTIVYGWKPVWQDPSSLVAACLLINPFEVPLGFNRYRCPWTQHIYFTPYHFRVLILPLFVWAAHGWSGKGRLIGFSGWRYLWTRLHPVDWYSNVQSYDDVAEWVCNQSDPVEEGWERI